LLVGGDGRDLLIVGTRSVRIAGNADDDVLIAGYTVCGAMNVALAAMMVGGTFRGSSRL
jgi:hypothetical protein